MELPLTEPIRWADRATLPMSPGIYLIAKGEPNSTVYIGRTWNKGGLRGRIRQFNRSATTGRKGHARGVTYFQTFGSDVSDLWVSVHTADHTGPDILHSYIAYAERRLIWEYVEIHRRLPACNSE